ncbi:MAG: homoserine dehydrogenase [Oscillospiraceae bacterium]|nr:homoserine dehydrogenase [Oscillospiraceae bacterium]MBQ8378207.1 homoserine dehydrogenase [Oscillospiraceae bacterium]MBQ8883150.1 homoserine dehydrogenase [Oscillospiraceae bacterium]
MAAIAIIGHGVVGSGTVELFEKNKASIEKKIGRKVEIKRILDIRDFSDSPYAEKFTKNFDDILNDSEIEVVAEVVGGKTFAYEYTKKLLLKGKSVVTSNKELVATHGAELLAIAKEKGVNYLFEASVGGGIPIIRPLNKCLAGNSILKISGILNGTTNFILTKMIREQMDFDTALKMAQELGYAEADPTADVEGLDAQRKICILGSLAYGKHIYPENVHCEGITKIKPEDVLYAENAGYGIKLIGSVKQVGDKVSAIVCPRLISKTNLLASVDDVYNGISVEGDGVGDTLFYGRGAGKLPTASAVVGDLIDALKHNERAVTIGWDDNDDNSYVVPYESVEVSVYVRAKAEDADSLKSKLSETFGKLIFIERNGRPSDEIAFITPLLVEKEINDKLNALSDTMRVESKIRLL